MAGLVHADRSPLSMLDVMLASSVSYVLHMIT